MFVSHKRIEKIFIPKKNDERQEDVTKETYLRLESMWRDSRSQQRFEIPAQIEFLSKRMYGGTDADSGTKTSREAFEEFAEKLNHLNIDLRKAINEDHFAESTLKQIGFWVDGIPKYFLVREREGDWFNQ